MKHKKKIRMGIQVKIIIPTIIVNIIIFLVMGIVIYENVSKRYIMLGGSEALSVTNLTSSLIDGDQVLEIAQTKVRSKSYDEISDMLMNVKENTGLAYVYIIGEVDGSLKYIFDTSEDVADEFDDIEMEYVNELISILNGNTYCTDEIERSEYGILLTA